MKQLHGLKEMQGVDLIVATRRFDTKDMASLPHQTRGKVILSHKYLQQEYSHHPDRSPFSCLWHICKLSITLATYQLMSHTISSDEESCGISLDNPDLCFFSVPGLGGSRYFVILKKDNISFRCIRDQIIEDHISVPDPFRFTIGENGDFVSQEQENKEWDWSVITKQEGEDGTFDNPYTLYIEEGTTV